MAQTKSKPKKRSAPKRAKSSSAKASKPKASKPRAKSAGSNGAAAKHSNVDVVRHAVEDVGDKAKGAGKTVGKAASRAKLPLVAGGAAIAGAAGGLALASSKGGRRSGLGKAMARRPKVKVTSRDVAKAAKEVGNFSTQMGKLAGELHRARESANNRHRSPIEVVLQGLTSRR